MKFDKETFYTPEQVAGRLQLSLTTVYNLIKSKEIPAMRIGKCFRIPDSELSKLFTKKDVKIPEVVARFIEKLKQSPVGKKIMDVILFGSYARGEAGSESDVDILIIYTALSLAEKGSISKLEDEVSGALGYLDEMNVIKKSMLQWELLKKNNAGIYQSIAGEGISLWKDRRQNPTK